MKLSKNSNTKPNVYVMLVVFVTLQLRQQHCLSLKLILIQSIYLFYKKQQQQKNINSQL